MDTNKINQSYYNRDNFKAFLSIIQSLGFFTIGLIGSINWPFLLIFNLAITAIGIHGMFVLMHECHHNKLFSSKFINDSIGTLISLFILHSYFKLKHLDILHHQHLGNKLDPYKVRPFDKKSSKFYFFLKYKTNELGITNLWSKGNKFIQLNQAVYLIVHLLIILFSKAYFQYLLYFIIPLYVISFVLRRFKEVCEHGGGNINEALQKQVIIRTVLTSGFIKLVIFPHNSNFHLEHHLFPNIPHYNLKKVNRNLDQLSTSLKRHKIMSFKETLIQIFKYADSKCSDCTAICPLKKPLLNASKLSRYNKSDD